MAVCRDKKRIRFKSGFVVDAAFAKRKSFGFLNYRPTVFGLRHDTVYFSILHYSGSSFNRTIKTKVAAGVAEHSFNREKFGKKRARCVRNANRLFRGNYDGQQIGTLNIRRRVRFGDVGVGMRGVPGTWPGFVSDAPSFKFVFAYLSTALSGGVRGRRRT